MIERGCGLFRLGGDLLSRVLGRSTIGAAALNGRVRDGIGCFARARTTKPEKPTGEAPRAWRRAVFSLEHETRLATCPSVYGLNRGLVGFRREAGPACFRIGSKPIGRLVPVS